MARPASVNVQAHAPAAEVGATLAAAAPPLPAAPPLTANFADWTMDDVCRWLVSIDLGHLQRQFRENRIKGAVLAELSEDDLKEAGVTAVGDRKWFQMEVRKLLSNAPTPPARPTEAAPAGSAGLSTSVSERSRNQEPKRIKLEDGEGRSKDGAPH